MESIVTNIVVVAIVSGFIFYVVAKGLSKFWPRSGRMGINLEKVSCPQCGEKMSQVRKPANISQALWGGWTCGECGTEMDKYGERINS